MNCGNFLSINYLLLKSLYLCDLGAHAKFRNPMTTPCWDFSNGGRTRKIKFPLAPMGSSLLGLRTRDPPLGPPSTIAEIFRRTCLGGDGNCLTVFLINFLAKSENSKHFSFFSQKKEILTPHKIWRPPLAPWGGVFMFYKVFF